MSAAIALLALWLAAPPPAPGAPDSLRIPFTMSRGKIVVAATLGDSRPLRLILDTGMGYDGLLIYNPDLRDSLGLAAGPRARIGGAGSGAASSARTLDSVSFRVGPLELHGQRLIVLEGDAFRGFPSDGVTGYSLFGHHVVTIDHGRRELVLRPPGSPPPGASWTALPLTLKESGLPWLELTASMDGRDSVVLSCYIDLASSETVEFLTRDGQRFTTPAGLEPVTLGRGLSGEIQGGRGRVSWVRLGPHRLPDLRVAFTPAASRTRQAGADATIGNGLLRRFDCVFDYGARRLYLRPNAAFAEPP